MAGACDPQLGVAGASAWAGRVDGRGDAGWLCVGFAPGGAQCFAPVAGRERGLGGSDAGGPFAAARVRARWARVFAAGEDAVRAVNCPVRHHGAALPRVRPITNATLALLL